MDITLEISDENEGTRAPWWSILDPGQNMDCSLHTLAGMITGPFFSREDATNFLAVTRYNFGPRAKVYCHSGCYSRQYDNACKEDSP